MVMCTLGTRGFSRVRREFSVLASLRGPPPFPFLPIPYPLSLSTPATQARCWPKADTSSVVGRSHERRKTWQKPETALEKSLEPRVGHVRWCHGKYFVRHEVPNIAN